jgi:hypothetical protein
MKLLAILLVIAFLIVVGKLSRDERSLRQPHAQVAR